MGFKMFRICFNAFFGDPPAPPHSCQSITFKINQTFFENIKTNTCSTYIYIYIYQKNLVSQKKMVHHALLGTTIYL